jgi:hypothetical protein
MIRSSSDVHQIRIGIWDGRNTSTIDIAAVKGLDIRIEHGQIGGKRILYSRESNAFLCLARTQYGR